MVTSLPAQGKSSSTGSCTSQPKPPLCCTLWGTKRSHDLQHLQAAHTKQPFLVKLKGAYPQATLNCLRHKTSTHKGVACCHNYDHIPFPSPINRAAAVLAANKVGLGAQQTADLENKAGLWQHGTRTNFADSQLYDRSHVLTKLILNVHISS